MPRRTATGSCLPGRGALNGRLRASACLDSVPLGAHWTLCVRTPRPGLLILPAHLCLLWGQLSPVPASKERPPCQARLWEPNAKGESHVLALAATGVLWLGEGGELCGGAGGWQVLSAGTNEGGIPRLCLLPQAVTMNNSFNQLSLCRDLLAQPPCPCSFASSFFSSPGKNPWLAHDRNPNESSSPSRAAGLAEPQGSRPQPPPFAFNPGAACSGALGLPILHPMGQCRGFRRGAGVSLECPPSRGLVVNGG